MGMSLFDHMEREDLAQKYRDWRPSEPPILDGITDIQLDFETTGLKWWAGSLPVGVAYYLSDGRHGYLPWGHRDGRNLSEETVKRWFHEQVKFKHITNANIKFEVHMAREWGVDLEELGNTLGDVQYYAALLDDHRKKFSQEVLCEEFLQPDERKVEVVDGVKLDGARMAEYPSGMVAVRAIADVRQVKKLRDVMWPMLEEQGLMRVRKLEDDCIYATAEMERNAACINRTLLVDWVERSEQELLRILWNIERETKVHFTPTKSKSWLELFQVLKIPITEFTEATRKLTDEDRQASFTDAVIKTIEHPIIKMARRAAKLESLRSKYIGKYVKTVGPDNLLRFALHQLRSDEGGTISGRYSSSAIKVNGETIGANIQQVMTTDKQRVTWGFEEDDASHDEEIYVIRKLFVAASGLVLAADAKQIEYRLFADYTRSPKLLKAYADDPDTSFHKFMWALLKAHKPDLTYKQQKNLNFMRAYGGGLAKLAQMMGHITESEYETLKSQPRKRLKQDPRLTETFVIDELYRREMPEVQPLLDKATSAANERGYVMDLVGRRMRFPLNELGVRERTYKALNGVIQGGAASVLKQKTIELHRARKRLGYLPRMSVHDELVGDIPDVEAAREVEKLLNTQSFPELKIPILWEVSTGPDWASAQPIPEAQFSGTVSDTSRNGRSR